VISLEWFFLASDTRGCSPCTTVKSKQELAEVIENKAL
jgi:hypothetical protein